MHRTRRQLLRVGAAGVGAGALGTTAGCLGLLDGDGGTALARWLPAPSALGVDGYGFHEVDYQALVADDGPFDADIRSLARTVLGDGDGLFPDLSSVERLVYADSGGVNGYGSGGFVTFVALGSFDTAAVADSVTSTVEDVESGDPHRGYETYRSRADPSAGVGISSDAVVTTIVPSEPRDSLTAFLDAAAGEEDRYADVDAPVGSVFDALDGGLFAGGGPGARGTSLAGGVPGSDDVVAGGLDARLEGEEIALERLYVFESAEAAEAADLGNWSDDLVSLSPLSEGDLSRSQATVRLSGSVSADEVTVGDDLSLRLPRTTVPSIAFDFDYLPNEGVVEITHEGGDSVSADNTDELRVRVDGETAAVWFDAAEDERVAAGDQIEVSAEPGATVAVVWVQPESGETVVLSQYEVPA